MGGFVIYSHRAYSCQVLYDLTIKISEEKKYRPQIIAPVQMHSIVTKLEEQECQKLCNCFCGITDVEENKLQIIGYKVLE